MCPVESVSGRTIDTIDLNREQDADIRGLMANNEYDPETYAHNCKPVGIIYKKNKDILEKYELIYTEQEEVMLALRSESTVEPVLY